MKLITKEVEKRFLAHPFHSQESLSFDAKVLAKFFDPTGRYTYFVTEAEKEGTDDWNVFGYCVSPLGADCDEWGYSCLSEITSFPVRYGLKIERDMFVNGGTTVRKELSLLGLSCD